MGGKPFTKPRLPGRGDSEPPTTPPTQEITYSEAIRNALAHMNDNDFNERAREGVKNAINNFSHPDEGPRARLALLHVYVVARTSRGMTDLQIAQLLLTTVPMRIGLNQDQPGFDCKVCDQKVAAGEGIIVLPCAHSLHATIQCAANGLTGPKSCPKSCFDWPPEILTLYD